MSYDVLVQRFEQGDATPMPAEAFLAVFAPKADRRDTQHSYWHKSVDDGGTADVYATLADDTLGHLMISRFSAGVFLDMLVTFLRLTDAVVLPPGCPTLLVHEGQRCHLPEDLRADAVVVQSGADVSRRSSLRRDQRRSSRATARAPRAPRAQARQAGGDRRGRCKPLATPAAR
ncbi:hypothetical protein [Micromonospora sp. NPDC005710]|uniref:hypothetical protein n=1 Tax=Micromonospora sp. NPDC005710 TaxID=3157051 RepID=UPI0033C01D53